MLHASAQCHLLCRTKSFAYPFLIVSLAWALALAFGKASAPAPDFSRIRPAAGPVRQLALRCPNQYLLVFRLPFRRVSDGRQIGHSGHDDRLDPREAQLARL